MTTNNINTLNGANTPLSSTSPFSTTSGSGTDQRNMFMTLLVAQLKNQDPLAPQDGAQFVAQLAQFNSLDQLIGIRQSIEELLARSNNDPTNADTNRTNSVQSFQLT
jgi:flagellar basal-body rod modification protein FlgD